MATSSSSSWIDLLSSNGSLVVRDNTPAKDKCQLSSLLRDKRRLTEDAVQSRERVAVLESELASLRIALTDSHNQNAEVCSVLEEQSKLITELRDSIGLSEAQATISNLQQAVVERDHMVQGMYAHVQELRDEVNRLTQSVLPPSNSMVDDLERLTGRNAQLRDSLSATQHSRALLERELISLQSRLVDQKSLINSLESDNIDKIETLTSDLHTAKECLVNKDCEISQLKKYQLTIINDKCHQVELLKTQIEQQLNTEKQIRASETRALQYQVNSLKAQIQSLYSQLEAKDKKINRLQEQLGLEMNGSICGSEVSFSSSISRRTKFKVQAELTHLKQRLSDSRASSSTLEIECAQLKTDNARLTGSQQALLTIKQQLLDQNNALDNNAKSFKNQWQTDKIAMSAQINHLHNQLNQTKELVSLRELDNIKCVAIETDLNLSKHEVLGLRRELSHVTLDLDHVMTLCHVTEEYMLSKVDDMNSCMFTMNNDYCGISEQLQLTSSINDHRQLQLKTVETSVSELCGEIEVLRARRKVAISVYSGNEVTKLRVQLKREKQQTNFVRLRLGYVIGELRLYKQLKLALENRLQDMEHCLENLHTQHLACVNKLQQTELN